MIIKFQASLLLSNNLWLNLLVATTSGSYLLIASLDIARKNLALNGREIFRKTVQYAEYARSDKPEIDFCLEIEQEDMSLFFDKEVVTIILDNLISNDIKYTEKGTITLGLHQVVRNNIHHTEISVSDTGFGCVKPFFSAISAATSAI